MTDNSKSVNCFLKYSGLSLYILFFIFLNIPMVSYFFGNPDQGAQLSKAMEILNGIHPFVDIKGNIYGPFVFYFSALGQLLSGGKLIGEVLIIVAGYFSAYFILYVLVEKITKDTYLSFFILALALTMFPRFYKYYIVFGPMLFLIALYQYIHNQKNRYRTLPLALAVGTVAMFRFDFGVYSFIIGIVVLVWIGLISDKKAIFSTLVRFCLGISIIVLPWLIFVWLKSGSFQSIIDMFGITRGMAGGLARPIPVFDLTQSLFSVYNNFSLLFWLFRLLPFTVMLFLFRLRKTLRREEMIFMLTTSLYAVLLFIQALHRSGISHLLQVIPVGFLLSAWLVSILLKRREALKHFWIVLPVYISLILFAWGVFFVNNVFFDKYANLFNKYEHAFSNGFTNLGDLMLTKSELHEKFKTNRYIKISRLVRSKVEEDEPVLFIPLDPQLYYFSERVFRTSLGVLGPGRLNSVEQEKKFFKEIIDSGTRVIVDKHAFVYDKDPLRNPRVYYPELMKLIYSRYRIVGKQGSFLILSDSEKFDSNLFAGRYKPKKIENLDSIEHFSGHSIEMDTINTFPPESFNLSVLSNSFLFVRWKNTFPEGPFEKKFLFMGLKRGTEIFYSKVRFKKTKKGSFRIMDNFLSLVNTKKGVYEIVILYRAGERILIKNSNVHITVI